MLLHLFCKTTVSWITLHLYELPRPGRGRVVVCQTAADFASQFDLISTLKADDSYAVDIKSIKISPDPPQKGQDLNVTVSGTVKEVVEVRSIRVFLWRE